VTERVGEGDRQSGAIFSADQRYRYVLWRVWGESARRLVVIGLNPSTADAPADDPTIRRLVAFAKGFRRDGLVMLNLFAFRATRPSLMLAADDPIGPDNDRYLDECTRGMQDIVVVAWGAIGAVRGRDREVAGRLRLCSPMCFGVTKSGQPRHPLYLKADTPLVRFHGWLL
jgi:hypothetical protein